MNSLCEVRLSDKNILRFKIQKIILVEKMSTMKAEKNEIERNGNGKIDLPEPEIFVISSRTGGSSFIPEDMCTKVVYHGIKVKKREDSFIVEPPKIVIDEYNRYVTTYLKYLLNFFMKGCYGKTNTLLHINYRIRTNAIINYDQ